MFDSNKINAPTAPMPGNPRHGSKCSGLWIAILAIAMGFTTGSVSASEEQTNILTYHVDVKEGVTALLAPDSNYKFGTELTYLPDKKLLVPSEFLEVIKNGAEIVDYVIVLKESNPGYRFLRCRRRSNGNWDCP